MNHKKITVTGIMITVLFLFSSLKPMEEYKETEVEVRDEIFGASDFANIKNFIFFKDLQHLESVCKIHNTILNHRFSSNSQRLASVIKWGIDHAAPPLTFATLGWSLYDFAKKGLSLKNLVLPAAVTTVYTAHRLTKNYFDKSMQQWDKQTIEKLNIQNEKLCDELDKATKTKIKDELNNQEAITPNPGSADDMLKQITVVSILKTEAYKSQNFSQESKTEYDMIWILADKWLRKRFENDENPLQPHFPGAQKYIAQLNG